MMARVLEVSRSGFCSWLAKGEPDDPWAGLRAEVKRVWLESGRTFGARFALAFLPEEFAGTTLYRVMKCMKELGTRGIAPKSKKRTAIPDEDAPARPDLMKRDFASPVATCKLVGDITYLRIREGWLYLATVIDLCTRMVVGWALSERHDRRHRGRGARTRLAARLRRRQRDLPFRPRVIRRQHR